MFFLLDEAVVGRKLLEQVGSLEGAAGGDVPVGQPSPHGFPWQTLVSLSQGSAQLSVSPFYQPLCSSLTEELPVSSSLLFRR